MAVLYSDIGNSVKMRLYSLNKRHILIVFLSFFASFFMSLNFGFFGPKMLKVISFNITKEPGGDINLKTGPFYLLTPYLDKFHQQLWLTSQPIIKTNRKEEFRKTFQLSIHFESKAKDSLFTNSNINSNKISQFNTDTFNRTRYFKCANEACDVFSVLHLDYLHSEQYSIELRLSGLDEEEEDDEHSFQILNFKFTFNLYNPAFTTLEIWFRFMYLAITFLILIIFTRSLNKFSIREWSIEQKWMFILLRSLLLFNNPLFPLNLLIDSWIPRVLDAVFQSTFLALLMVFWLSIYHGVRQSDRNFLTFYLPKFIIVFLIWLMSIILLIWQQIHSAHDPTYDLAYDERNYFIFRLVFLIALVVYLLTLLYLMIRAIAELKNMPYIELRLKFASSLMFIVMMILISIALFRVYSEPFRQSLFENFTKNYRNSIEFCSIFSLFNIYVYAMAFVYSPAANNASSEYRDNPTFTMLNDTDDEDTVFGMNPMNNKSSNN